MEKIIITSLIITAIHIAFKPGNVLSFLRVWIANGLDIIVGMKWSKYVQKPLWDCLPCMASVWTVVITGRFDVILICAVCGLNVIIGRLIEREEVLEVEQMKGTERVTEYFDEAPTITRQKLKF